LIFAGWSLAQLAVLFGVGGAAITGLYLLRMRRRQVVVPFAELWQNIERETDTRKLWRRLRRLLSWLVQMILLALLCLALGDPRPEWWFSEPRTVAVIIDVSASMDGPAGADTDARARLDLAVRRAQAELAGLGHRDRAVVIAAGFEPRVVSPLALGAGPGGAANSNSADLSGRVEALRTLRPQPGRADMAGALALARNTLAGYPAPEIIVITDGALAPASRGAVQGCLDEGGPRVEDDGTKQGIAPRCRVAMVTGPDDNLAITAFAARRYPGDRQKVEVLAEVRNLGASKVTFALDVLADGVSVGRSTLELGPGATTRELLPELDAARARLEARLVPVSPDAPPLPGTPLDDVAWAVVPPLDPIDVALVSDGTDLFLEAALLALDDHVRLTAMSPDEFDLEALADEDLVILDVAGAPLPDPLPDTNLLVFDPHRNEGAPVEIAKKSDLPRPRLTEQDRNHPILEGVVFKDVNMSRGTSFETEATDLALVKHLGEPMVVLRERPDRSVLLVGFDPRQSDLPLRVAFPLLVSNVIDYFESRRPGFVATVPAGSSRELSFAQLGLGASEGITTLEIEGPGGTRQIRAQDGRFRMLADEAGIHTLRTVDGALAGATIDLAVNMADVEASDLRPRLDDPPPEARADAAPPPAPVSDGPLWTLLLAACLLVLTAEWATYHRRRTV